MEKIRAIESSAFFTRLRVWGMCGALALTLSACPVEADSGETPILEITHEYSDGQRRTKIKTIINSHDHTRMSIEARCEPIGDGSHDLIETNSDYREGNFQRSVGHPACADGQLTPKDFEPLR